MKILIVDDDPGCRDLLHSHLNWNHEVSILTNGRNALALLADDDHDFDLILLDLHMPRMSGEKLIEVLNECQSMKARFIIMSGMPTIDHILKLPNVLDLLRKPFDLATLDAVITHMPAKRVLPARLATD